MNYEPEQLTIVRESPVPDVPPPPDTPQPDVTPPEIPKEEEEIECPAPNQPRVGDLTQNGEERVIGHELSADGKTCVVSPTLKLLGPGQSGSFSTLTSPVSGASASGGSGGGDTGGGSVSLVIIN